jgi:uncharacterized membrane protein YphA (DoxX/SURF4 family)
MPTFLQQLEAPPIDAADTRFSRWLRARWLTFGAGVALVEGTLVVAGAVEKWIAFAIACIVLFVYFSAKRERLDPTLRIVFRVVAFSQLLMLAVPLLLAVLTAAAITALVLIALVVAAMLFRRHF